MSDDLISRQAAIENYQRVCAIVSCDNCPFHIVDGIFTDCRLEKWLKSLPTAPTASPRWIPATERMPEIDMSHPHHEDYLVQYDSGDMDVASWSNVNRFWADHVTKPHWNCGVPFAEVTAWMPLPEPWKGEDDGI